MKTIKTFYLILASLMTITMQLKTSDKQQSHIEQTNLSTNDAESKIATLQKQLVYPTNEAAKTIVEAILVKNKPNQTEKIKKDQDDIITSTKNKLKITYDTIKAHIDQEQKNTSYFSQFIASAKNAGKYFPYFFLPMEWVTGGPQYTDQEKDLARAIIAELEKRKADQPKNSLNTEISKQQLIAGNPMGVLKTTAAVATILGTAMLLDKYTGFLSPKSSARLKGFTGTPISLEEFKKELTLRK